MAAEVGRDDPVARELLLGQAAVPRAGVGDAVDHEHRRPVLRAPRVEVQAAHPPRMVSPAADVPGAQTNRRLLAERSAKKP